MGSRVPVGHARQLRRVSRHSRLAGEHWRNFLCRGLGWDREAFSLDISVPAAGHKWADPQRRGCWCCTRLRRPAAWILDLPSPHMDTWSGPRRHRSCSGARGVPGCMVYSPGRPQTEIRRRGRSRARSRASKDFATDFVGHWDTRHSRVADKKHGVPQVPARGAEQRIGPGIRMGSGARSGVTPASPGSSRALEPGSPERAAACRSALVRAAQSPDSSRAVAVSRSKSRSPIDQQRA